ncbi:LAFA_0F20384g1_1 [Lachancea sp. 'fantastica']|nr:LAFA_0F20384g1_1 [Lachancea sp. 'fantastica']
MSQFDLQQAQNHERRNKLRNQALDVGRQHPNPSKKMLDKLCKWSRYSRLRDSNGTTQEHRIPVRSSSSLKRVNSLSRRKNFSTRAEIQSVSQFGNFVFHRGFSLKRSRVPSVKGKFRNQSELASAMDYIDPRSMAKSDFTSAKRFLYLKLKSPSFWQLLRLHPQFVFRTLAADFTSTSGRAKPAYGTAAARKNSIRRVIPNARMAKRANTYSGPYHRSSSRSNNKPLYDMWRQYLSHVISQRIEFRLYLNGSLSDINVSSGLAVRSSEFSSLGTPSEEAYFPSHSSSFDTAEDDRSTSIKGTTNDHSSYKLGSEEASIASTERSRSSRRLQKVY